MHSNEVLMYVPFVVSGFWVIVKKYISTPGDRYHMQITRELSTGLLCGVPLATTTFSRVFSATPYIQLEQETIFAFFIVQLFCALIEFRGHLNEILFCVFLFCLAIYLSANYVFWQTVFFWLMTFSVLRSPETLTLIFTDQSPRIIRLFRTLSQIEFLFIFGHILEMYVFRERNSVNDRPLASFADVLAALAVLALGYGGVLKNTLIYHVFNRDVVTADDDLTWKYVVVIPPELRIQEEAAMMSMRESIALQASRPTLMDLPPELESGEVQETEKKDDGDSKKGS